MGKGGGGEQGEAALGPSWVLLQPPALLPSERVGKQPTITVTWPRLAIHATPSPAATSATHSRRSSAFVKQETLEKRHYPPKLSLALSLVP